jgi:DNA repair photolyase
MLLTAFDPWKSPICTCPPKLTFNPYTGCDHGCLYCYASSYIPHFHECRPKKNLLTRLTREATRLNGQLISMSNSSDPYPQLEQKLGLTRKCLQILANNNCKLQIVTKSNLVTRDIDILQTIPCVISVTILTLDDSLCKKLEPGAPVSSKRLSALKKLVDSNISTTIRIDPIIPFLNDDLSSIAQAVAELGVSHVTCSTYKVKPDNWKRFSAVFPDVAKKLKPHYFTNGERISGSTYLPEAFRFSLMKQAKNLVEEQGLKFGCCRENFNLNSEVCDGSWVVSEPPKPKSKQVFF